MIVLATDFGLSGPYVGQMKAVLTRRAPGVPLIDLFHDLPAWEPRLAAYLLSAFADEFPAGTVFLCVVDPGVGGARAPLVVEAAGRWFVGPDNGLFEVVARRATSLGMQVRAWAITWTPERLSASFHGRDLFAPVAAMLALGQAPPGRPLAPEAIRRPDWPDDLWEVVYLDPFGNALVGVRATGLDPKARISAGGRALLGARTFSDVPPGQAFWYENANGLLEIAVNQGRAGDILDLRPGSPVRLEG